MRYDIEKNHKDSDVIVYVQGELCNDWVKAMLIDSRGLLWIATSNGICVMNPADRNFKVFGWKSQLTGLQCFSLCEQQDGNILVGTESGLYVYDRQSQHNLWRTNPSIRLYAHEVETCG